MTSGIAVPKQQALWAVPGLVFGTWFLWGALTKDIKEMVGLYYDPDALLNRVEAERVARLQAKAQAKSASSSKADEEEEDEEEEEEEVTHEDIQEAVEKAVQAAEAVEEEEEEAPAPAPVVEEEEEAEEEEEEEEETPKVPRKKLEDMTMEEKYDFFAEKAIVPGDDDDDDDDDEDDVSVRYCLSLKVSLGCCHDLVLFYLYLFPSLTTNHTASPF